MSSIQRRKRRATRLTERRRWTGRWLPSTRHRCCWAPCKSPPELPPWSCWLRLAERPAAPAPVVDATLFSSSHELPAVSEDRASHLRVLLTLAVLSRLVL